LLYVNRSCHISIYIIWFSSWQHKCVTLNLRRSVYWFARRLQC